MSELKTFMEDSAEDVDLGLSNNPVISAAFATLLQGDHERAERRFRRILQESPRNHEALAGLAICVAEDGGKYMTAQKLALQSIKLARKSAAGYIALGYINLRASRLEEGWRHLMKAKHLAPRDPRLAAVFALYDRDQPPMIAGLSCKHPVNMALNSARSFVKSPMHKFLAVVLCAECIYLTGTLLV